MTEADMIKYRALFHEYLEALTGVAIDAKVAFHRPSDAASKALGDSLGVLREHLERIIAWNKQNGVPESSDALMYRLHFLLSMQPQLPPTAPLTAPFES